MSGWCCSRRNPLYSWIISSTGVSKYSNIPPPSDDTKSATSTATVYAKPYNLRPRKSVFYGEGIYTPPGSEGEEEEA